MASVVLRLVAKGLFLSKKNFNQRYKTKVMLEIKVLIEYTQKIIIRDNKSRYAVAT